MNKKIGENIWVCPESKSYVQRHNQDFFEVFSDGREYDSRLLGCICPGAPEDFEECLKALDAGEDPITDGWEDGVGNTCVYDGWGDEE